MAGGGVVWVGFWVAAGTFLGTFRTANYMAKQMLLPDGPD